MTQSKRLYWEEHFPALRINGAGYKRFLQGQTTVDIFSYKNGVIFQSCWLTSTGRLRGLLEIKLDNLGANIILLAGHIDDLVAGFEQVIFPSDQVQLEPVKNIRRVQMMTFKAFNDSQEIIWLSNKEILPESFADHASASTNEVEYWRLTQGLPVWPNEINGETNPFELGLSHLISLDKGCYLGQETMAKLSRVSTLKQKLRCWSSSSFINVGQNIFKSRQVVDSEKKVGTITSVIKDPMGQGSIGLAIIRKTALNESKLYSYNDSKSVKISVPNRFVDIEASDL